MLKNLIKPSRIALAGLILVTGIGLTFSFGEQPSHALTTLPAQAQQLTRAANGQLIAGVPAQNGKAVDLYVSTDKSDMWQAVGRAPVSSISALAVDTSKQSTIYVASGTRVLQSDDNGATWKNLPLDWASHKASDVNVTSFAKDTRTQTLLLGTTRGLFETDGKTLTRVANDELANDAVTQVLVPTGNPGRVLAAATHGLFERNETGNWTRVVTVSAPVRHLVEQNGALFVASGSNGLYRSFDAGHSWTNINAGLGIQPGVVVEVTALASHPREQGVLYTAIGYWLGSTQMHFTPGGIFVSLDGGNAWKPMTDANGKTIEANARVVDLQPVINSPLGVEVVTKNGRQIYTYGSADEFSARLNSPLANERAWAAKGLGMMGEANVVPMLLPLLTDQDAAVGFAAANAIGRLNNNAVVPALIERLNNANEAVRMRAAMALGALKAESAIESLARLVETDASMARGAAAEALANIGTQEAARALVSNLVDDGLTARRQAAMNGLETMGAGAISALDATIRQSTDVVMRRNATETLGWIDATQSFATLETALQDESAAVRAEAAWALGEIGGEQARQALLQTTRRDSDASVRSAAVAALERNEVTSKEIANTSESSAVLLNQLSEWFAPPRGLILAISALLAAVVLMLHPLHVRPRHPRHS